MLPHLTPDTHLYLLIALIAIAVAIVLRVRLLRTIFDDAGLAFAMQYSGHSLRRGFANWATANGWDIKTLMEYVGWRDVHSAMRYVDTADPFAQHRISEMLALDSPN